MAISWSSYVGTTAKFRIGIEVSMSPATVTAGTSSVDLTWTVYQERTTAAQGITASATVTIAGSPQVVSASWPAGSDLQRVLYSDTQTVSTSFSSSSHSATASMSVSSPFSASVSRTLSTTVPAKPPSAPSAPTAATATYVSDSRINVAWTRPGDADAPATIWNNAVVQRQSVASPGWATVATIAGSASSWADTTVSANERYRYRVTGTNGSGEVAYDETGYVSTTPAAPSGVTAVRDGADIIVAWTDNAAAETGFEVQDGTTAVGSPVSSPFTHVAPSNLVAHAYRVRAVADGPRYSAWSPYSEPVNLEAAPAAPDNLTPNGSAAAHDVATVLAWSHNPVDTTAQTAYELEHRLVGAGTWTSTGTVSSGTSSHSLTAGTYSIGSDVEWRVRTKGAHVDFSPWSAVATFTAAASPTATINEPSGTVGVPSPTIEWTFYHPGGNPQSAYEVRVEDDDTGALLASTAGSGTDGEWTVPTALPNLTDVKIRVRVRESLGIWSAWDEVVRSVNYDPPAEAAVTAAWVDGYGHVLITAAAVDDGVSPETVDLSVERSVDGGNTWVTVVDGLGTDANVTDWESPAAGTFHYRVTSYSALPSAAHTVVEVTVPATPLNRVVWISGGPGFAICHRVPFDIDLSGEGGRERVAHNFSGRSHPVEFSSRRVPRTIDVSGTILPDAYDDTVSGVHGSSREELQDLFDMPGPHLFRDSYGAVVYGIVSPLQWTRTPGGKGKVSFSITRSARGTDAQLASLSEFYAPRIAEVAPGVYQVIGADVVEAAPGVYEEVE